MQRRRTTTACARCHHRKRKCDKKFPRCTSCKEAGVECKGLSRDVNVDAPRSVVQYLEHAISQVEAQLVSSSIFLVSKNSFAHRPKATSPSSEDTKVFGEAAVRQSTTGDTEVLESQAFNIASTIAFASGIGAPSPVLINVEGIPYKEALLQDTELPLPLSTDQMKSYTLPHYLHGSESSKERHPEPLIPPLDTAQTLFDIYVKNILPQNPCFFEDDIHSHFNAVYFPMEAGPPEISVFFISMALAISTMTSKAYEQNKILTLSESLHRQALRHSKFLSSPTIRSLQGILLLLQLAELLPYTGNLWHLAGEAVSLSTELGLHQDPHKYEGFDFKSLDLRRRIFWTVYCLERSVAVTSYRPYTLKDEVINTALPSEFEDVVIRPEGVIAGGRRSKIQFLHYIRFRQIQSEILEVQFFNGELIGKEHPEWVSCMEKRLVNWQQTALADVEKSPDWFSHALWQCYLMLHRPCPRNPSPSENSIATCVDASLGLSSGSWELLKTGYLQYPFHNAHNGFEAATVILYGLRYHTMRIRDQFGSRRVIDLIHQLSELFTFLSPRWPAAAAISGFFDSLKKITIKEFLVIAHWTPSPHNPIDLIVLHRPIESLGTSISTNSKTLAVSDIYDESDIVLSHILGNDPNYHPQIVPEISPWENFWDMGSMAFEPPRNSQWPEMIIPVFPPLSVPLLASAPVPTENYVKMRVSQEPAARKSPSLPPLLELNLEILKKTAQLLPACNRCRTRRIKCQRMTLECEQCKSSNSACIYFDHLLSKTISSRHIDALHKRLSKLLENQDQITMPANLHPPQHSQQLVSDIEGYFGVFSRPISLIPTFNSSKPRNEDRDLTYESTIYFGITSTVSQLAKLQYFSKLSQKDFRPSPKVTSDSLLSLHRLPTQHCPALPPLEITMALLGVFNKSFNLICHLISMDALQKICGKIYGETSPADMFDLQTLHLVLAVTLQTLSARDQSLSTTAEAYFQEVASDSGRISSLLQRNNLKSLRVAILLCAYVALRPKRGDLWRLVGFASRLCLGMINAPRFNKCEKETFEHLYQALLCIDCRVSLAFGRPSQLPDFRGSITTTPMSMPMNFTEQLTSYYQKIRLIDGAMHNAVMRKYTDFSQRVRKLKATFHSCGEQLEDWKIGWNAMFNPSQQPATAECPSNNPTQAKQWGDLEYFKTLQLIQRLSPSIEISPAERLQSLQLFLRAYKDVYYDSAASASRFLADPLAPFNSCLYPALWTNAQSVLAAALDLVQLKEHLTAGSQEPVFRSCITILALLESDPNNMLDGLTQIVEQLYDS